MLFPSLPFLNLFLPLCLAAVLLAGTRGRNAVLLLASLVFYAWGEGRMVLVMLASIGVNFGLGAWVGGARARGEGRGLKVGVACAVAFNLGLLALFKYAAWLLGTTPQVVELLRGVHLEGPPIGISFFTFQALSYVLDVAAGRVEVQRSPLRFGLYIALFPQLIAGPIVRYHDVAAQLERRRTDLAGFAYGVRRFVTGLGKKVLIAGTLAPMVDAIFALPAEDLGPGAAWLGLVGYTLQIYFDFSGYSDMAIGLGHLFGFRFLENFLHPYVSRSVTEFWRRWHVSLSTWFRDYLYVPLGGNRHGVLRTYRNLGIVFLLCGLWHGASWTYVAWGAYHGLFLIVERAGLGRALGRAPRALGHAWTLLVVMGGWVLFRASSIGQAGEYARALAGAAGTGAWPWTRFVTPSVALALGLGVLGSTPWVPWLAERLRAGRGRVARPWLESAATLALLLVLALSLLQVTGESSQPFIYFRF